MVEDVSHYRKGQYLGPPDQSFEWLWEASSWYLLMKREDHTQESLSPGLHGVAERALPATEPKGANEGQARERQ